MLFALEANGATPDRALSDFWREFPGDAEGRPYAEVLVRGVTSERADIDLRISRASDNWRIERMTRIDRNVLRIGTWELVHERETPRAVILDEAVELAKQFGTEDSGSFVNGVLARIADDVGRPVEPPPSGG
jgi:transcription antitermination protein NusB